MSSPTPTHSLCPGDWPPHPGISSRGFSLTSHIQPLAGLCPLNVSSILPCISAAGSGDSQADLRYR